jgi:hypothetical protein
MPAPLRDAAAQCERGAVVDEPRLDVQLVQLAVPALDGATALKQVGGVALHGCIKRVASDLIGSLLRAVGRVERFGGVGAGAADEAVRPAPRRDRER